MLSCPAAGGKPSFACFTVCFIPRRCNACQPVYPNDFRHRSIISSMQGRRKIRQRPWHKLVKMDSLDVVLTMKLHEVSFLLHVRGGKLLAGSGPFFAAERSSGVANTQTRHLQRGFFSLTPQGIDTYCLLKVCQIMQNLIHLSM